MRISTRKKTGIAEISAWYITVVQAYLLLGTRAPRNTAWDMQETKQKGNCENEVCVEPIFKI